VQLLKNVGHTMIDPNKDNSRHPLDATLEDARMNAQTDWEEQFVDEMLYRRKRHGSHWTPTDAMIEKLKEIAQED
jgi:hypothetical protein